MSGSRGRTYRAETAATLARPANPYVLTPLTAGVGFYGREAVLRFVRNTLTAPFQNVVVLYGQRRIGKTSLLYQLMRPEQGPPGFRPVYFDLQGRAEQRLNDVLFGLARAISRSVGLPPPTREAFADDGYFRYGWLPTLDTRLGGERLLLLVDEFDVLGGEEVPPDAAYHVLFSYLQDLLIVEQRRLAFVFVVGRRIDELPSRIKATFKSAQCKRISVLDPQAAESLIREPASGVLTYQQDAVDALLQLTSGHPYFLQLLCYELFERAVRSGSTQITKEAIGEDLLAAAMELGMGGLAWFWDEFPPAERFILAAIAHLTESGQPATLSQIGQALREHGVQLQGMELSTAPNELIEWEIIEPCGRDAYHFRVEFLRRWLYGKHSLEEAKRELEQVSSRAVRLYELARRRHRQGNLSAALVEYRRALAANPNHARAQLGLAQACYESGRLELATEAFEKAHRLDPESARDGLIAAHRDLGTMFENEGHFDQARAHYHRVLDLAPDDQSARQRLRDCWRATAGAHLAAGRWDKAIEAYREALRYFPEDEYLTQAVATLEERHVEAEALQRRRQQLERAVLEARLKEEQARRSDLQDAVQRVLGLLTGLSAAMVLIGFLAASLPAHGSLAGLRLLIFGGCVAALGIAHAWARRRLT